MLIRIFGIIFLLILTVHTKQLSEAQKKSLDEREKCLKAGKLTIHPLDCCRYPRFFDNSPQNLHECDYNCRTLPYPLFTCIRNCIIERYGVLTRASGGIVGPNRIVDAFFDQDEIEGARVLPPEWRTVVINSSIICVTEFPLSPFNDGKRNVSSEESWNYYYTNYVECIRKRNFLECRLNNIENCTLMREAITHCHASDYPFLHKLFFEEFYYRNRAEEERKKRLKMSNMPDLYEESHKNGQVENSTGEATGISTTMSPVKSENTEESSGTQNGEISGTSAATTIFHQ